MMAYAFRDASADTARCKPHSRRNPRKHWLSMPVQPGDRLTSRRSNSFAWRFRGRTDSGNGFLGQRPEFMTLGPAGPATIAQHFDLIPTMYDLRQTNSILK